eukprot:COSAG04_NODE_580_length_12416_cov_8.376796_4_plen_99_part_00
MTVTRADGSGQVQLSAAKAKQLLPGKRSDGRAWTGLLGDHAALTAKTTASPRTAITDFVSKAGDGQDSYDLRLRTLILRGGTVVAEVSIDAEFAESEE